MSADLAQIKLEIKEWQRAHRRIHGRDPGKDELKKNPEMQAKYKIWQASLKADKDNAPTPTATTPPKRTILPKKTLPTQSTTTGPTTPFSARKHRQVQPASSSPPKISNPFSQSPSKGPRAPDFSAASSSKSSRTIAFNSASSARHRPFPMLNSDSDQDEDEDDNPFAPTSPTRSRRPSQLVTPSKSALRRKSSGALSSPIRPNRGLAQSPTRAKLATLTPRTKARKRMRGEEVPATPGDKRRKLVPPPTQPADHIPPPQFGFAESRGTKRPSSDGDEDDDEIMDSPRKKSAVGSSGRVFASVFDESPRKVTFAFSDDDDDGASELRSSPPPPPSSDAVSPSDTNDTPPPSSKPTTKPLGPIVQTTNDKWDAPVPGMNLSHLRKGQFGKKPPAATKPDKKGKEKEKETAQDKVANPFELLPIIPGDEPPAPKRDWKQGQGSGKDWKDWKDGGGKKDWSGEGGGKSAGKKGEWKSAADMKKRAKELAAEVEANQGESSDADVEVEEIEWRPHGPLRQTLSTSQPTRPPPPSQELEPELDESDPAHNLPSDLRTLLSIDSSKRDHVKEEALARDVMAGRARMGVGVEVWGVGWEEEEGEDGEGEGDWESEPEGWIGGVEM